jgi:hypothetical protein
MKSYKRTTAILVTAVLAVGMFGAASSAAPKIKGTGAAKAPALSVIQPTLSLQAFTKHRTPRKITARGFYDNVSSKCKGPGGRSVSVYVNGSVRAGDVTRSSGRYWTRTDRLSKGTYEVQSFVEGAVSGGYSGGVVCNDAWSNEVDVRVKGHHHDDDDDH